MVRNVYSLLVFSISGAISGTLALNAATAYGADSPPANEAAQAQPAPQGVRTLSIRNVKVQLDMSNTEFAVGTAELVAWVERSVNIVADYYGRFPCAEVRIRVLMSDGSGVRGGTTWGSPEARIRVRVGKDVIASELVDDWVLVHEMIHLALPEVGRGHGWLAEGVSTYVEGIARAQAGNRSPVEVWNELMRSMPRGLPQAGDQGLDNTHTWGRTYWGGALFCLLADVEMRRRTKNKFGLQDALRAVAHSSNGLASDWPIDRVFATGDAAVGVKVLEELYAQMKDTAVTPDLAALWNDLGIDRAGESVSLRQAAPLASVREAIMRQPRS